MIGLTQRNLPVNTQHSQQTNIHAPAGIWTQNLSRRAAVVLRLRPRDNWDRLEWPVTNVCLNAWKPRWKNLLLDANLAERRFKFLRRDIHACVHNTLFRDVMNKLQSRVLEVIWSKIFVIDRNHLSIPLSSYVLLEGASSAIRWSKFCLYTVVASGCVVLHYGGLITLPNSFTNEEYSNKHVVYSFCTGNGRAAGLEYFATHIALFHIAEQTKTYAELDPRHERTQYVVSSGVEEVMVWQKCKERRYKQNLQDDWCIADIGMDNFCAYHRQKIQHVLPGDGANLARFCLIAINAALLCLILYVMYFYCYVYVFLLLCMLCSVYSVFIVPTGIFRLP